MTISLSITRQARWPDFRFSLSALAGAAALTASGASSWAQDDQQTAAIDRLRLETSIVTGQQGRDGRFFDADALSVHADSDIWRILRTVPGIHIREEDGFGLRPNIGLRGSEPDRSAKISITEDGVPIAPAPYAAPSAYYFPHASRMSSIAVVTGPDSLRDGPNTLGGSLNMHTIPIPTQPSAFLSAHAGQFGGIRTLGRVGGTHSLGTGLKAGVLLEALTDRSQGFKELDTGTPTGFLIDDYMGKFSLGSAPEADTQWQVRLKLHRADQHADETYLGLTEDDFAITPLRRYAASGADRFDSLREEISADLSVSRGNLRGALLVYRTTFSRNWHKLERVNPQGSTIGSGTSAASPVSSILASPNANASALAIIRGQSDSPDGALLVRNNNRSYLAQGAQFDLASALEIGSIDHSVTARLRVHHDQVDRFQNYERYTMTGGTPVLFGRDPDGSESNRIGTARAVSLFAGDRMHLGSLTITPALRAEWIDTERLRYDTDDPTRSGDPNQTRSNDLFVALPGVSVGYDLSGGLKAFASVHRGFSPPGPGASGEVDAEVATSYEAGLSWTHHSLAVDARLYYSDYDNLLGTCTVASGCSSSDPGDQFNGGRVGVWGADVVLSGQWESDFGAVFPVTLTYAHTDARFGSSFDSGLDAWEQVVRDDVLPNIPPDQISVSAGAHWAMLFVDASASWVSDTRTRAGQGAIPDSEKIPAHTVVDLAVSWAMTDRWHLSVRVKNLFDETYVASRVPAGLRPGLPRQILIGLNTSI